MEMGEVIKLSLFMYGLTVVVAMLSAVMIKGIVMVLSHQADKKKATTAAAQATKTVAPKVDAAENDVAVISAAVYAMLGTHRIVHIGVSTRGSQWAAGGRAQLHTSRPKRR